MAVHSVFPFCIRQNTMGCLSKKNFASWMTLAGLRLAPGRQTGLAGQDGQGQPSEKLFIDRWGPCCVRPGGRKENKTKDSGKILHDSIRQERTASLHKAITARALKGLVRIPARFKEGAPKQGTSLGPPAKAQPPQAKKRQRSSPPVAQEKNPGLHDMPGWPQKPKHLCFKLLSSSLRSTHARHAASRKQPNKIYAFMKGDGGKSLDGT